MYESVVVSMILAVDVVALLYAVGRDMRARERRRMGRRAGRLLASMGLR